MGEAARLAIARTRVTDKAKDIPGFLEDLRVYEAMLVTVTQNRIIEVVEQAEVELSWLSEDDYR